MHVASTIDDLDRCFARAWRRDRRATPATRRVLLTMSRHPDQTLDARATAAGASLEQWAIDLADAVSASARLEAWLESRQDSFSSATLINNAALAGKAGPISESDPSALAAVLRVGLEAPMLLTRAFLRATRDWSVPRKVLNISSGAGKKPLPAPPPIARSRLASITFRASSRSTKHTDQTVR